MEEYEKVEKQVGENGKVTEGETKWNAQKRRVEVNGQDRKEKGNVQCMGSEVGISDKGGGKGKGWLLRREAGSVVGGGGKWVEEDRGGE